MLKHAYMIIAHHEFSVLERLVSMLDDIRNDIYIHFDKKVKVLPTLTTKQAKLYILNDRVDVRWGNVSQIESELLLFRNALNNKLSKYSYFHLLSGVHIPLKSQNELHQFFESRYPNNIFCKMLSSDKEIELKLNRYNFFTRFFIIPGYPFSQRFVQFVWKALIQLQKVFGIKKNTSQEFIKAANWVSLTRPAIEYLVINTKEIIDKYKYTLCGDEYFVPTELKPVFPNNIHFENHYLKTEFNAENPKTYRIEDFDGLVNSSYLFARKFSETDLQVVDKLYKWVNSRI